MKNYFTISEFCIENKPVPQSVADKILKNFIEPLNPIRELLEAPIIISQNSGYRSAAYEYSKKRSPLGVHTFTGMGAADLTSRKMKQLFYELERSPFTRICYYPKRNFIHVDYEKHGTRFFFDNGRGWQRSNFQDVLKMF
jgi:hypothetical protein